MPKSDIERDFPSLIGAAYDLSDEDFNYNCLAYALGDQKNWWEPPKGSGQYWPPGFPDDVSVKTVELIIRKHGFTVELMDKTASPETDAIAIYAEGNMSAMSGRTSLSFHPVPGRVSLAMVTMFQASI